MKQGKLSNMNGVRGNIKQNMANPTLIFVFNCFLSIPIKNTGYVPSSLA